MCTRGRCSSALGTLSRYWRLRAQAAGSWALAGLGGLLGRRPGQALVVGMRGHGCSSQQWSRTDEALHSSTVLPGVAPAA